MADLVLYTNPMSRGRIARWMLEEIGAEYDTEIVAYDRMKDPAFLAVNPMVKVPAISHRGRIVTECAAICAYLADAFPEAGLGPNDDERADYYRWLFYAAGPVEQAVTNHHAKWDPAPEQGRMFGYGSYDKVVAVLDEHFSSREYVCGSRFTAADVYVGSAIMWGTMFGTLPKLDSFVAYAGRLAGRDAHKRATAKDDEAAASMQAAQPLPQTA